MIVHRDRQYPLRVGLPDDVIVQNTANFLGCRDAFARFDECGFVFFAYNIHAEFNAFIADEYCRPGNQFPDFVLALAAE